MIQTSFMIVTGFVSCAISYEHGVSLDGMTEEDTSAVVILTRCWAWGAGGGGCPLHLHGGRIREADLKVF